MSTRFDTIFQSLFSTPMIVLAIACILTTGAFIIKWYKEKKDTPTSRKVPTDKKRGRGKSCKKTKEGFVGVSYGDIPSGNATPPSTRTQTDFSSTDRRVNPFEKKPNDLAYDDYEASELEAAAAKEIKDTQRYIEVKSDPVADFGATFNGAIDAAVKEIPWDSDNKDVLPSDILWGIVSKEASKSIYGKIYTNIVLSDPTMIDVNTSNDPLYRSLILDVDAYDIQTSIGLQAFEGIASAQGQRLMPWGGDLYQKYEGRGFFPRRSIEPLKAISRQPRKFLGDLKMKFGVNRAKQIFSNLSSKISSGILKKLSTFVAKYVAKRAIVRTVMYGTLSALSAAAVVTAGILSTALAIFSAIIAVLEVFMNVMDFISIFAYALIPTILNKFIDTGGLCPGDSKSLTAIMNNDAAYFFFTNFVPLGDLFDILDPYMCWDNGEIVTKVPLTKPPYTYDSTLSIRYHQYSVNETMRPSSYTYMLPPIDTSEYDCINGTCYSRCPSGTWTKNDVDPICRRLEYTIKMIEPTYITNCNGVEMRPSGVTNGIQWVDNNGVCLENGEVKKEQIDRYICPIGYSLDRTDKHCYEKCITGYGRVGTSCWGDRGESARTIFQPKAVKEWDQGYKPPERLEDVTFPWCNFANPIMLDRMAQFYYDQSSLHPTVIDSELNPGTTLIEWEYITKFYGVIASSELSCDVACKIKTVQYNPYTGEEYSETSELLGGGCKYDDDSDTYCYRRFYFIKQTTDPQGIFTVSGCTNSDYTAPEAQVNSWEDGVEYVPSLPKVFIVDKVNIKPTWSMSDIVDIGTGILGGGAGYLTGRVGNLNALQGRAATATLITSSLGVGSSVGAEQLNTYIKNQAGLSTLTDEADSVYLVGDIMSKTNNRVFSMVSSKSTLDGYSPAHMTIQRGIIKEQAEGLTPQITRCSKFIMDAAQCSYKYILRDTIDRYHKMNPTRRIKQVDIIEPRGKDACYYRWKEVNYDITTNKEGTEIIENDIIQKYVIRDLNTCVYEADSFVENKANEYPIRKFTFNGADAYPTRKAVTKPVRYVRIELTNSTNKGILRLSQVSVFNTELQNVSKYKDTKASPEILGTSKTAVVDGKEIGRDEPFIYISSSDSAYFEIDLATEEYIQSITVYTCVNPNYGDDIGKNLNIKYKDDIGKYSVICYDAARQENYRFRLQAVEINTLRDFPPITLEPSLPRTPFLVPQTLPVNTTLGGDNCPNTTCATARQMDRLILDFNKANENTKIIKIIKAVTPKTNRCDYEVEMMRVLTTGERIFQRETVYIDVAQSSDTPCVFTRIGDGIATLNSGTFIQSNTPALTEGDVPAEVMSFDSIVKSVRDSVQMNYLYIYDSKPLDNLRTNIKDTNNTAKETLSYLTSLYTLDGCPTKCSDPDILKTMYNAYNNRNTLNTEQYGVERNTVKRILRVAAASPTECDALLEEQNEIFEDILQPHVTSQIRIKAARFTLTKTPNTCNFSISEDPSAIKDINSNSITLQSPNAIITPPFTLRNNCIIDCLSDANISAVKQKLEAESNKAPGTTSVYTSILQTYRNGSNKCEYKMLQNINEQDPYTKMWATVPDVETYIKASFTQLNGDTCTHTLSTIEEYQSDLIDLRLNMATQEYDTYYNGKQVSLPFLFSYDSSVPSPSVDTTVKRFT